MGLFDKKYCDICGEKIGLLGNRRLEDGNLCKDCAKKLSRWFSERRASTVEQIRSQLEYREQNRAEAKAFRISRSFGNGSEKLYIDDSARKFTVNWGNDFEGSNPDILGFSQARGCDLEIEEDRDEIKRTVDGNQVSYNPPRYKYSYRFKVTIQVDHPYFDDMYFDLNGSPVSTGETCMTGHSKGSWHVTSVGADMFNRGTNTYHDLVQKGNEIKEMIDGWKNGGSAGSGFSQGGSGAFNEMSFSTPTPMPYYTNINGSLMSLFVNVSGTVVTRVADPATFQRLGGYESLNTPLNTEMFMEIAKELNRCATEKTAVEALPGKAVEIGENIKKELAAKWYACYGIAIQQIQFRNFDLTPESMSDYTRIKGMMAAQTPGSPYVQQQVAQTYAETWKCPYCDSQNTGKFCTNCGAKRE